MGQVKSLNADESTLSGLGWRKQKVEETRQANLVSDELISDTFSQYISLDDNRGRDSMSQNPASSAELMEPAAVDRTPPGGSAVIRAIEILEVVTRSSENPQLADICRAVGLPKATVYRILGTLEHAGFVIKEPGAKRYQTGRRLHDMALQVLRHSPAHAARHAILEELVEQIGETCNLVVPDQHTATYLDRVEAAWPLRVNLKVGTSVPLYASASGKLFLSGMSRRSRERFLRATPLVGYTARTHTCPDALTRELEAIRRQGFAMENEEYLDGVSCLAVPIRNASGELVAAVSAHGSSCRVGGEFGLSFLDSLSAAARQISKTFGY